MTAFTTVKIAAVAPIPNESESSAANVTRGDASSTRMPYLTSAMSVDMRR
jgi:hypothetical protein